MKILNLFFCGVAICFFLMIISCNNEEKEVLESINAEEVVTRSGVMPPFAYVPEWWDGKSQLNEPYEYQTSYQDYPYNKNTIDTCDYYFSFVYTWGTSYASQYYHRFQLQYRHASATWDENYHILESLPDSKWSNIGTESYGDRYPGGIVPTTSHEIDIDAKHLPQGYLNFRYRLLHTEYPATRPQDTIYNNTILSTKWHVVSRGNTRFYNSHGSTCDSLFFHVNFPIDLATYNYSVYVDNKLVERQVRGNYACARPRDSGEYLISAMRVYTPDINESEIGETEYRSGTIRGAYDRYTKDIYVTFTSTNFAY